MNTMAEKMRILRAEKGITQLELAAELYIDRTTIAGYETGKRTPDIYTLCRIATYYNVTLDYLVGHVG